ncbi:LacI family DNA-binding transcriptional regulator [Fodinibius sp. SL11]|uniref:LacI family DNA-binding transcriptional regulator n=1 Tax=Fodinibius sp. SL11 TaxID=3425690 RepID=UPI003F883753
MGNNKKYTVEDVAREADVSTATVSRVFSGSAKVNKETTEKVLQAAKKLDYRPNRVASRLRGKGGHSKVLGLIVTDLQNPFFSDIARGVGDIAYENDHGVIVCNTDEDPEKERFYLETLLSEKVAGLIIAPTIGNKEYLRTVNQTLPLVSVDRHLSDFDVDTVTVNNKEGSYLAVKRLLELGHKRIGIVCGIEGILTTEERLNGYKKALKEENISINDELIFHGNSKEKGGVEGVRHLLNITEPPTAIYSTNNLMTLGIYEELYRQNVKVPNDVAIVGFDDMSWATALNPPLTAVRQPGYELGATAVELLLKRLSNPNRPISNTVLKAELIIRHSCGNPK